jgi:hypothetical protein
MFDKTGTGDFLIPIGLLPHQCHNNYIIMTWRPL